jgi:hypothetical protein
VATSDVLCGLQVTDFDSFLRFFSCHLFFFLIGFAFREFSSWKHFWPFTEVTRRIQREVTRKTDGPMVAQRSGSLRDFERSGGLV